MPKSFLPGNHESGYGARAPMTRWVDSENQLQREKRRPRHPMARVAMEVAWRGMLPLALGTATDIVLNHNFTVANDLAYSALYAVVVNGGERALSTLGSLNRENARRRHQRHQDIVSAGIARKVEQQNRRDKAIHEQGVTAGADRVGFPRRVEAVIGAIRGDIKK